jgi:long-subunit fatty acid transport protein
MKFYFLTNKTFLSAMLFVSIVSTGVSQETGVSPYSRFGLGDLNTKHSPGYASIGGASVSLADYTFLNINNPASYSFLKENRPVFEADFTAQYLNLEANGQKTSVSTSNVTRFALGFPVSKKMGLGMGVLPFSSVGYDISSQEAITGVGNVDYLYNGSGGLNRAFVGLGHKIIDNDSTQLSVGANASFIFGGITSEKRAEFPDDDAALNSLLQQNSKYKGVYFDLGLQFKHKLSKKVGLSLGANVSTGTDLKVKREVLNATYANTFLVEQIIDTLSYTENEAGTVTLPLNMVFGASVSLNNNFEVSAQYAMQDWSVYKEVYAGSSISDTMQNSTQMSLGIRFRPEGIFSQGNLFERTQYRLGVRYNETPLQYNGTAINEFGMSFGLGLPITRSTSSRTNYQSVSTLHIGVEYGNRGATTNNLIKENFTNIYIGVSIMPSRADRWFKKRKIN